MASTAPRDIKSPVASKLTPKAATSPRPRPETAPWFWKTARLLGSLQFAITTGSIFTLAMIVGTCLESWYSDKIAQEMIYYSWWFTALLGLLACSIFFAAIKKWPWKKHQIGFLITHVGLLTLLAGGVLNSFFGVDAVMQLVDSKMASQQFGIRQRSNTAHLSNEHVIVLERLSKKEPRKPVSKLFPITPGPLPWGTSLAGDESVPGLISVMNFLSHPWPRTQSHQVDDLQIDIIAHLPHTRVEQVEAARDDEFGFPAVKVEINTRELGHVSPRWVALNSDDKVGPPPERFLDNRSIHLEFLGSASSLLLEEFLKPPPDQERGKSGQLVVVVDREKYRIDVAAKLGQTIPLGTSGWKLALDADQPQLPLLAHPYVLGKLIAPDGTETRIRATGRLVMYPGPLDKDGLPRLELPPGMPAVWYTPVDLRYGLNGKQGAHSAFEQPIHIKSMLQFLQTDDRKLYYRSLVEKNGTMVVESAGPVPAEGLEKPIWENRAGSFLIEEHLPRARPCEQRIVPVPARPGLIRDDIPSALLCRVTLTKKDRDGKAKTFVKEKWLPLGREVDFSIANSVSGESFNEPIQLIYQNKILPLGFDLELTRAESQLDPGTNTAATYSSFVKLYDPSRDIQGDDHMITMNEPLDYLGYKVYQSRFQKAGLEPGTGKPVAISGFTIGRDPGLWLKYLGTAMLGVGIATMFFMRAYFFKPKARQPLAAS